jgi:Flp pilus assembly pilin Flp
VPIKTSELTTLIGAFLNDDSGAAVAEYGLLLVALAFTMLATLSLIGHESTARLASTQTSLNTTALAPP